MFSALLLTICILYIFNINVVYAGQINTTDTYSRDDKAPSGSSSSGSSSKDKTSSSEKSSTKKDSGKSITEYMQEIEKKDHAVRTKISEDYKTYPINWTTVYNQLDKARNKGNSGKNNSDSRFKTGETIGTITIREYEEYSYPTYYIENNTMVWYTQVTIKPKIVAKFSYVKDYETKSSPKVQYYNWYMTGPEKRNWNTTTNTTKVTFTKAGTYNTDSVPYITWTVTTNEQYKISFDAALSSVYDAVNPSGNMVYYVHQRDYKTSYKTYQLSTKTESGEDWSKVQKFQTVVRVQDLNKEVTLIDTQIQEGAEAEARVQIIN